MTDEEHAKRIKYAVRTINEAMMDATNDGLRVTVDVLENVQLGRPSRPSVVVEVLKEL